MKRFYKQVTVQAVDGGWGIALDGRPLRTPAKHPLTLPTQALAEAIANEWHGQGEEVKPQTMPLTQLASTCLDGVVGRMPDVAAASAEYGGSELLCYRADEPPQLVARQVALWQPLLDWAARRYDANLRLASGIIHVAQPPQALNALRAGIDALDAWRLTALQNVIGITGSLVLSLAFVDGRLTPEETFDLAQLDENFQIERWGEDWEAADRRNNQRADLAVTRQFLDMLPHPPSA